MNLTEQTAAIQAFGYTAREAVFIATAALHSGYFLRRQFSPKRGKRADDLCRKLLRNEHATATVYAQNTQLFHLCAKPIYSALEQEDNRHRRQQDPFLLRAKLMGLDYVLTRPEIRFLPTETAKLEYFVGQRKIPQSLLPSRTYTGKSAGDTTVRFFIEKYPVWIDPETARVGFAYMDDGVFTPPSFANWLRQHYALITELGAADVVYVSVNPSAFVPGANIWARTFSRVRGSLPPELQGYFELRFGIETRGLGGRSQADLDRYRALTRRFAEAKFQEQYVAWKASSEREKRASQPAESLRAGATFSTYHLSHSYRMFGSETGTK